MNANGILGGRVSPEIVTRALYLVALSVTFLHAGALIAAIKRSGREIPAAVDPVRQRATRMVGWCLLAGSTAFTCFWVREVPQ